MKIITSKSFQDVLEKKLAQRNIFYPDALAREQTEEKTSLLVQPLEKYVETMQTNDLAVVPDQMFPTLFARGQEFETQAEKTNGFPFKNVIFQYSAM